MIWYLYFDDFRCDVGLESVFPLLVLGIVNEDEGWPDVGDSKEVEQSGVLGVGFVECDVDEVEAVDANELKLPFAVLFIEQAEREVGSFRELGVGGDHEEYGELFLVAEEDCLDSLFVEGHDGQVAMTLEPVVECCNCLLALVVVVLGTSVDPEHDIMVS